MVNQTIELTKRGRPFRLPIFQFALTRALPASMATPPCLVQADGAARLRRWAAPSADIYHFCGTLLSKTKLPGFKVPSRLPVTDFSQGTGQ